MQNEVNYKESWDGSYKGVNFEVVHWRLGWNYYITIPVDQLPIDKRGIFNLRGKTSRGHTYYESYKAPIISNLEWHGGITLYEKLRNAVGKVIAYRMGCDYMHLWDENSTYDCSTVIADAKHTIDTLWERIPNLKLRCAWNGKYYDQSEVFYTDKGVCVAKENKIKWETPLAKAEGR